MHSLQQALWREEHDREDHGETRGSSLDVSRGDKRLDVVRMCADCRVVAMSEQQFDPFAGVPERASPRTTDDYLRERETKG